MENADSRLCIDQRLIAIGRAARKAAPPVVAASSIGTWYWCPLKAWHNTTLFNSGWLSIEQLNENELEGLALLWAAEFAKKSMIKIIHGKIMHGEEIDVREVVDSARIAKNLANRGKEFFYELVKSNTLQSLGLIDPASFEKQLAKYRSTENLVEYSKKEEWPLIARQAPQGFYVIGVPDRIEWQSIGGGLKIVELKTTSKPHLVRQKRRSYKAALAQLATYSWILSERWPVEEAVLVVLDDSGRVILKEIYDPLTLSEWFEESIIRIALSLIDQRAPQNPSRTPCKSCEYGGVFPGKTV